MMMMKFIETPILLLDFIFHCFDIFFTFRCNSLEKLYKTCVDYS